MEALPGLSDDDLQTLADFLGAEMAGRATGDRVRRSVSTEKDDERGYKSKTWGRGRIQRDRRTYTRKDGSLQVYRYWYFHWIEGGKHHSQRIGKTDEDLERWKRDNPEGI